MITFLKVNVDLLRVLIEIRNIRSGDLVAPTAFDSRIISANDDNMLHVLCACGLLVPRVVSQIAGLAIEKWYLLLQLNVASVLKL